MKLNPEAFRELYHFHNKNFYHDSNYKTYKNYLILAADGSNINVPRTAENLETFGTSSRHESKPQPALGLGCIYDVLNKFILKSECGRGKFNELACAELQLKEIHNTIGNVPFYNYYGSWLSIAACFYAYARQCHTIYIQSKRL